MNSERRRQRDRQIEGQAGGDKKCVLVFIISGQ